MDVQGLLSARRRRVAAAAGGKLRRAGRAGRTFHRGSLRLTNDGHSAQLRMDVVRDDGRPARALQLNQYS
jgi:hypothetical protein